MPLCDTALQVLSSSSQLSVQRAESFSLSLSRLLRDLHNLHNDMQKRLSAQAIHGVLSVPLLKLSSFGLVDPSIGRTSKNAKTDYS